MCIKFLRHLDYFFNKMIPKKLLVWIVATILCFNKILPGDLWAYITMIYLGVNVISKFSTLGKSYDDIIKKE